jgi:hypothetical protein
MATASADATPSSAPMGVMDEPRPEYDARGIPISDWLLFPSLAGPANFDDNVFRSLNQRLSDWYFETTPGFRLQRKTKDGVFDIFGDSDTFNYVRFPRLNLTDWTLGADGKVNLSKNLAAAVSGYYGEYHEDFSSVNEEQEQQAERNHTRYFRGHLDTALSYGSDEWLFSGGASLDLYWWQPTAFLSGAHFPNTDRDAAYIDPFAKVTYQIGSSYQLYVKALYDIRNFDQPLDRFGFDRASSGNALDGGVTALFGKVLSADVYLGYRRQDFRNHVQSARKTLHDISELDYGAAIDWYAAPTLTAHLTAARTLSDIILQNVSLSDDQSVKFSVDWEARHDVLVQAFGGYTYSRLIGSQRVDRYPSAGVTLRYLINRYASAEIAYLYTARASSAKPADFADQIVTIGVNLHI